MKLDPRIIEGKKPFGCFETEEAKKFTGKECYFSDYECCFESLDLYKWKDVIVGTLLEVSDTGSDPYRSRETWFAYCLPLEFTENIQKKPSYRPFTLSEFLAIARVGDKIDYRYKSRPKQEISAIVSEVCQENGNVLVKFGGNVWSFDDMLSHLELECGGEWYPFGVKE